MDVRPSQWPDSRLLIGHSVFHFINTHFDSSAYIWRGSGKLCSYGGGLRESCLNLLLGLNAINYPLCLLNNFLLPFQKIRSLREGLVWGRLLYSKQFCVRSVTNTRCYYSHYSMELSTYVCHKSQISFWLDWVMVIRWMAEYKWNPLCVIRSDCHHNQNTERIMCTDHFIGKTRRRYRWSTAKDSLYLWPVIKRSLSLHSINRLTAAGPLVG